MPAEEAKDQTPSNSEIKIVVVGELGVGKSTLITRFIGESFKDSIPKFEVKSRKVSKDGKIVNVVLYDTREQERFRTLSTSLYRGAKAVLFVFALDDNNTFANMKQWVEEAHRFCTERNFVGYLVGTKSDVVDQEGGAAQDPENPPEEAGRAARPEADKKQDKVPVDEKNARALAKELGLSYMRVSATDFSALQLFNAMIDDVWIRFIDPTAKRSSKNRSTGCCILM